MMKFRLLGAVLGLALTAGAASAADLYRAPAPVAVPVAPTLLPAYMWTGAYVGLQTGYGTGDVGKLKSDPNGWLAGVHAGANWQMNMLVAGIDGSWSWSNMSSKSADINWTGDVRGRLGVAFDRFHVFGTAGFAFADVDAGVKKKNSGRVETGWTAGLGAEYAITNNWIAGVEYKYADYGKIGGKGGADLSTNVLQVRLSYKF